jgi:hypothetical protein
MGFSSFGENRLEISEKFCPICKNKNERKAVACKYCGALLEETGTGRAATTRNTGNLSMAPIKVPDSFIDYGLIPKDGIAIYAAGTPKPLYIHIETELLIGRKKGETSEPFLDLSELDGFNLGLSRRHALIRRVESGFEVIDLSSTNGSWLNNKRLTPNKPYQLQDGAQMRFGMLQILIIFHSRFKARE